MKQVISILIIALIGISWIPTDKTKYSITKQNIENYRSYPAVKNQLLNVIKNNEEFIHLENNSNISEGILEHHLLNEIINIGSKTYIVFEYFSLEGVSCNIKAVTIDDKNNLLSIVRLAELKEYPDGELIESTFIIDDIAKRTTIIKGLQEYNDSLEQLIMKIDSTIITYKLNQFKNIELVDSLFKHYEYID